MGKIINECLSCESNKLTISKIECQSCHAKYEGKFDFPSLLKMSSDELNFLIEFVKCSGSLKEMAKQQKVSYPTMRNRLNDMIEKLNGIDEKPTASKEDILSKLEAGEISAKDAAVLLSQV